MLLSTSMLISGWIAFGSNNNFVPFWHRIITFLCSSKNVITALYYRFYEFSSASRSFFFNTVLKSCSEVFNGFRSGLFFSQSIPLLCKNQSFYSISSMARSNMLLNILFFFCSGRTARGRCFYL